MPAPLTTAQRQFTLNAALTKAYLRKANIDGIEVDQLVLSGIASSTMRDRHGDTITPRGQASMLAKLQTGNNGAPLAMFLNHSYNVPEDVLGHCGESQLVASADDTIDLEIVCVVTPENPRAVMAHKIVASGVPLGFSIGGAITECSVDEENDDGESWCPPLLIDGLDLFEISLCGIPANPRSYTDAAKSLVKQLGLPENAPEPTTDWARAMRLGFVRSATRNIDVRRQLRKALPALQEVAAKAMVRLTCTECDWKRDVLATAADEVVREHEDEAAHVVEREAIVTTTRDSDEEDHLSPDDQACVAECIGHLAAAMSHGGCTAMMDSVTKAHAMLTSMLTPNDNDGDSDDDDAPSNGPTGGDAGPGVTNALVIPIESDTSKIKAELAALSADVQALSAQAQSVSAAIVAGAAELAEINAQIVAANAQRAAAESDAKALLDQINATKAMGAGRVTVTASATQVTQPTTLHDAQRALGAALTNGSSAQANPPIRPA